MVFISLILIPRHFGKHIIARRLGLPETHENVELLWHTLYAELIESVDAIDNGINLTDGALAYAQRTDLSSRVKRLNPNWNEPTTDEVYDVSAHTASVIQKELCS